MLDEYSRLTSIREDIQDKADTLLSSNSDYEMLQTENSFRNKYTRYLKANTDSADTRRKARVAVAAKLARVAYSVVKSGKPYNQYFELALPGGKIPIIGP